jgi:hypothetical protein
MTEARPQNTPEARLSGQISALSDALDTSLSLAAQFATTSKEAAARRHSELDKAMKLADRSANLAVAISKLRGGTFNFNVRRHNGPIPTPADAEAARIAAIETQIEVELDRDLGPAFTPQEFSTITNEELRARCDKRQAERNRRRAARGLPVFLDVEAEDAHDTPSPGEN